MKIHKQIIMLATAGVICAAASMPAFAKRQPDMENAMKALELAEYALQQSRPDKGGHRARALMLIRKAKVQVHKGIEFANRRDAGGQYKSHKQMAPQQQLKEKNTREIREIQR